MAVTTAGVAVVLVSFFALSAVVFVLVLVVIMHMSVLLAECHCGCVRSLLLSLRLPLLPSKTSLVLADPDEMVQIPQDAVRFRAFVDKYAPRISQDSREDAMTTFAAAIARVVVIFLQGKRREVLQAQGVVAHDDWIPGVTVKERGVASARSCCT